MHNRRYFMSLLLSSFALPVLAKEKGPQLQVYKSPTCSCCGRWVSHMEQAGFVATVTNVQDVNLYKLEYGVPAKLTSCHTALVDGYIVEGHVPADDVIKMLRERPEIKGIGVPGMPIGSPGMEGGNPERYETLSFDAAGAIAVYAVHGPA